jgi:hypothetical protein
MSPSRPGPAKPPERARLDDDDGDANEGEVELIVKSSLA